MIYTLIKYANKYRIQGLTKHPNVLIKTSLELPMKKNELIYIGSEQTKSFSLQYCKVFFTSRDLIFKRS